MLYEINNIEQLRKVKGIWYADLEKWKPSISRWVYRKIVSWKEIASKLSMEKMCGIFEITEKDCEDLLKNSC